jgi:hypothetical protein
MDMQHSIAIAHNGDQKSSIVAHGSIHLFKSIFQFHSENPATEKYEIFEDGQLVVVADNSLKFEFV